MKSLKNWPVFALIFLLLGFPGALFSEDYPKKPISMIVAYSPGGGTDTVARVIAKYATPYLKKRLVIKNRPGAGGQIGFTALSREKNDGYNIGFINIPSILLVKFLRKDVPYDMSDFEPIANIQLDPVVLAVKSSSPYKTLSDFINAAKKNPGKVNVGGDGPQSNNQLQIVVAEDKLDFDINFVAFDGSGPAVTATLGGQVDASVPSATSSINHVNEGRLRILAVFSDTPYQYLPNVPTISQATGVDIPNIGASLRGIAAPKGMPADRKEFLENAFAETMKDKKFLKYAKEASLPLKYMNPDEFTKYLEEAEDAIKQYIHLLK